MASFAPPASSNWASIPSASFCCGCPTRTRRGGASDALACGGLAADHRIAAAKALDLVASRRLTLGAAQRSVPAILLRFCTKPEASTAETRWRIATSTSAKEQEHWGHAWFVVQLLRNRHGRLGHWEMEWSSDDGLFREPTPDHRAVVSASSD
jgi:hypothetical protein